MDGVHRTVELGGGKAGRPVAHKDIVVIGGRDNLGKFAQSFVCDNH